MNAMVLDKTQEISAGSAPLRMAKLPIPVPHPHQVLVKIAYCAVCHTELDEIEGRLAVPAFPLVPGHQVVGTVVETGNDTSLLRKGDRVGIAWIFSACGQCEYCRAGNENLCPYFKATGLHANGGYAEYMVVDERFALRIPSVFSDVEAAPLLCAGAIGYRSIRLAGLENGQSIGLMGFGASAHLVLKMLRHKFPESRVYVFARSAEERKFALDLGAIWAGNTDDESPEKLQSIIDTTPAWKPVVESLKNLKPGGRLVINAIRKEGYDKGYLLNLDYPRHLWLEKEIKSVANVTRRDVQEFLQLAAEIPIKPTVEEYPLAEANRALTDLKLKHIKGAKVLVVS